MPGFDPKLDLPDTSPKMELVYELRLSFPMDIDVDELRSGAERLFHVLVDEVGDQRDRPPARGIVAAMAFEPNLAGVDIQNRMYIPNPERKENR
jgi:hypothetical protein